MDEHEKLMLGQGGGPGRPPPNLPPADVTQEAPNADLPIAVGILAASEQLEAKDLNRHVLIGDLALTGAARSAKGVLPNARRARNEATPRFRVPADNAAASAMI